MGSKCQKTGSMIRETARLQLIGHPTCRGGALQAPRLAKGVKAVDSPTGHDEFTGRSGRSFTLRCGPGSPARPTRPGQGGLGALPMAPVPSLNAAGVGEGRAPGRYRPTKGARQYRLGGVVESGPFSDACVRACVRVSCVCVCARARLGGVVEGGPVPKVHGGHVRPEPQQPPHRPGLPALGRHLPPQSPALSEGPGGTRKRRGHEERSKTRTDTGARSAGTRSDGRLVWKAGFRARIRGAIES